MGSINYNYGNIFYNSRELKQALFESIDLEKIIFGLNGLLHNNFISGVRNGHFYTTIVDSFEDAQQLQVKASYWLLCAISELKK